MPMGARWLAAFGCVALSAAIVDAHRLDEYAQAALLNLDRDRVRLDLELTPGVSVAPIVLRRIDADGDGAITPAEVERYGRDVLSELELQLDGRAVGLQLERADAAPVAELRDGVGAIRLTAIGVIGEVAAGRRRLSFANAHEPGMSVYLVNALVPAHPAATVVAQTRDVRQQSVRIDYDVRPARSMRVAWGLVLLSGAAGAIWFRSARR